MVSFMVFRLFEIYLLYEKDVKIFRDRYLSPGNHSQKRGFPLSIRSNQTVPPASRNAEVCIFQQYLALGSDREIMNLHSALLYGQ